MNCLVVTPEKTELDIETTSVILPLVDGEYGIMGGHTPMVAQVGAGELRILDTNGKWMSYFVEGGFAEVLDDTVALLSMLAIPANRLDIGQAEKQLQVVLEQPSGNPELAKIREEKLDSCRARLRVAQRNQVLKN